MSMRILSVLSMFLALGLCTDVPTHFIEKAQDGIFRYHCYGPDYYLGYKKKVGEAIELCRQSEPLYTIDDLFDPDAEVPKINDTKTAEEYAAFRGLIEKQKHAKLYRLSNLTCTFRQTGEWNKDNTINIDFYTKGMWEDVGKKVDEDVKQAFIKSYNKCYKYQHDVPIEDDVPKAYKLFSSRVRFQKCAVKNERNICAKTYFYKMYEEKYGAYTQDKADAMALPRDKFDAGLNAFLVDYTRAASETKFIKEFIHEAHF